MRKIAFLTLILSLASLALLRAEDIRPPSAVPNQTGFAYDTSIGIGASAEAVTFDSCAHRACIENKSGSLNVLVYFVPCGTPVTASQLTTPTNDGPFSHVQIVYPVAATAPVPCFDTWAAGLIWQGETSAATAVVRVEQ